MPRKYIKKKVQKYSNEDLQLAIAAVHDGENCYSVSKKYNIPNSTLHDSITGKSKKIGPGKPTVLSVIEEECIVTALAYAGKFGWPFYRADLKLIVQEYVSLMEIKVPWGPDGPGYDFLKAFEKRWEHKISQRKGELVSTSRAKAVSEETLTNFFCMVENVYEEYGFAEHPERIFNCDETGFSTDEKSKKCFFEKGTKFTPSLNPSEGKAMFTVLFCGSADAKMLPPLVVYKGKYLHGNWCTGGPPNALYGVTKSGWMESYLFEKWFADVSLSLLFDLVLFLPTWILFVFYRFL
jgi:hypothetical protein